MRNNMKARVACLLFFCLGILFLQLTEVRAADAPPTFSNPLNITNPLFPFTANGVKVFMGQKGKAISLIVDVYLPDTRTFIFNDVEVACHIMQETEFENGLRSEISENYFAQADDGAVYYFGELVDIYDKSGAVTAHDGTWLVGGATLPSDPEETIEAPAPGLRMPLNPKVGDTFMPEDVPPTLNETDTVKSVNAKVKVPGGLVKNGVRIKETTTLDEAPEVKWWVPGIGVAQGVTKQETFALVATTFVAQ